MEVFCHCAVDEERASTQDLAEFWSVFGGPAWIIAARVSSLQTSESTPAAALAPAKYRTSGIEAQPPIADIGRSGCRKVGSSIPCPAAFVDIARTQECAI